MSEKVAGQSVTLIRQAGETGQLYGSVSARDVAEALTIAGFSVGRQQVVLHTPIKNIGLHVIPVSLHPEIEVTVTANVARSGAEAERQAAGEDLTVRDEDVRFETFSEDDNRGKRKDRGDRDDRGDRAEATDGEDAPAADDAKPKRNKKED
jgi:large subunit ribosomal protein L9